MPPRLTYLSSQPAKQESLEKWVLTVNVHPIRHTSTKTHRHPIVVTSLVTTGTLLLLLFKFRGMNSMSIPSPLSVRHTGGFFTRASQKAKNFLFSQVAAASTTHSINSRLGPGILHTRRGLLAVPPIFSTYSRLPFHLPLHNLTWSLPKPNKTAALTFWLQEILAWATHSPSISIPPSSPNCHSSQKCCKLWPNRRKKKKKKTPNDTYQRYTITSATKLVT